jgi:hypothetical protein
VIGEWLTTSNAYFINTADAGVMHMLTRKVGKAVPRAIADQKTAEGCDKVVAASGIKASAIFKSLFNKIHNKCKTSEGFRACMRNPEKCVGDTMKSVIKDPSLKGYKICFRVDGDGKKGSETYESFLQA